MKHQYFGMCMFSVLATMVQPVLVQTVNKNTPTEAYIFMASVVGNLALITLLAYIIVSIFLVVLEPANPKDKTVAFLLFGAPVTCGIISTVVGIACEHWSPILSLNLGLGFLLSFLNFWLAREAKVKN